MVGSTTAEVHPGLHVLATFGIVPFVNSKAVATWSRSLIVPISPKAHWPLIRQWVVNGTLGLEGAAYELAIETAMTDYVEHNFATPSFVKLNGHEKEAAEWQRLVKAHPGCARLQVGIGEILSLVNADGTPYDIKAADVAYVKTQLSARSEADGHTTMSKARQLIDEYTSTASIPAFDMPAAPVVAPPTTRPATRPATPAKPGVKPWKPTVRPGVQPRPKAKKRFQASLGRF